MKKIIPLIALFVASPALAVSASSLPVICSPDDASCPISRELLYNCDSLSPSVDLRISKDASGKIAARLDAEGKYDGIRAELDCAPGVGSRIDCASASPQTFSAGNGATVQTRFKISVVVGAGDIAASVDGMYPIREALNWPLNWGPVPAERPIRIQCLDRKQTVRKQLRPQICVPTDGGADPVLTYFTPGFQRFKLVGASSARTVSCSGQMYVAGRGSQSFALERTESCPFDLANVSDKGDLRVLCYNGGCEAQDYSCSFQ